jgi:hypothetical protein
MTLNKLIGELGPLTVLEKLSTVKKSLTLMQQDISCALPILPPTDGTLRANLTSALVEIPQLYEKKRIIVVGPELLILEVICEMGFDIEVLVAVNTSIPNETVARISANVPAGLAARVVQIPGIPFSIRPAEAVMIAAGFDAGAGNALVPESTRSILNFYISLYFGEVIMLDPFGFPVFSRPDGWVTLNKSQYFTQCIVSKSEMEAADEDHQYYNENRVARLDFTLPYLLPQRGI